MLAKLSAVERTGRRRTPVQDTHEIGFTKVKILKTKKRCSGRDPKSRVAKKRCSGRNLKKGGATAKVVTTKGNEEQRLTPCNTAGTGDVVVPAATAPARRDVGPSPTRGTAMTAASPLSEKALQRSQNSNFN